jgi:hypothetical protein
VCPSGFVICNRPAVPNDGAGDEVQEALLQGPAALQELSGVCKRLEKLGYAEREDRRTCQLIVIPPKKVLKAARA